jgi:phospholipase C
MSIDDRPTNEAEERLAAEEPESFLRRREFLAKTAAAAGVAGLATVLPVDKLVSLAAEQQTRAAFPSPRNLPLDNVVVLMMENRSFDHYFGGFAGADGKNKGLSYPDADGKSHKTHYLPPDYQGCGYEDPDHSFEGGRTQYNNGKLDGFYKASDEFAIGYYKEKDIEFLSPAAHAFTTYDRYFCSILSSTYPNRHYMISAQCGGQKKNELPTDSLGNQWETIFDRAKARGVDAAYYVVDLPVPALYGARGLEWVRPIERFYEDAAAGTLPKIAYVDPPFLDGGGGDGLSGDEHPHGDVRIGQAYMAEIAHAFMESPQWKHGALFINYDEWGGFFDHVSPVIVPDDLARKNLDESFGITGFRIPNTVISPFAKRGHVSHATITHESILKLISYRFGLGYLNTRHRYASQIGRTLQWDKPNREVPDLPSPTPPATTMCSAQGLGRSEADEAEELRKEGPGLGAIGTYAEEVLGYEIKPATPERVFRDPGRVKDTLAEGWREVQK